MAEPRHPDPVPGPERHRLTQRLLDLVERHGDDYLDEGKRLIRRLRRTVAVVGVIVGLAAVAVIGLLAYAILH